MAKKFIQKMKYFTITELCKSDVAESKHLQNLPTAKQEQALVSLINNTLDPARESLGFPVQVTSGFRSVPVNRAVGGASNSQHTKGQAADLVCRNNAALFEVIRKQKHFDQLIWEYGSPMQPAWVHVSFVSEEKNRGQVLRAVKINGRTNYIPYK